MLFSKLLIASTIATVALAEYHVQSPVIVNHGYADGSDPIFDNLSREDSDFINKNLRVFDTNGTNCDQCKQRIINAKKLVEDNPGKEHVIALLLYKYCLNTSYRLYCQWTDFFFISETFNTAQTGDENVDSGYTGHTSANFYDNDFLQVIKRFNTSSDLDLEYYCYFKGNKACKLPATPDIDELFDIESWWPEKQPQHYEEPAYTNNSETFNVLHASDFHLQLRYKLGAEANCSSSPCANSENYNKVSPGKDYNFTTYYTNVNPDTDRLDFSFYPDAHYDEEGNYIKGDYYDFPAYFGWNFNNAPATAFGAFLSDAPALLLNNSLVEMKKLHEQKNFEFLLFTGDSFAHDGEHGGDDSLKYTEKFIFSSVKQYLNDLQVFPCLGNHDEPHYAQVAPQSYVRNSSYYWNNDYVSRLWIDNEWFDESKAQDLKTHYTGYSYVTPRGLKVIGLNSNSYYGDNLWTYGEQTTVADKFQNWQFLIDELVDSESKNQRVWILAHIPPNNYDVQPIQSHIFSRIVKRFAPYTIANMFFGHTHRDQFTVYYSTNDTSKVEDALAIQWVIPSVTPFTNFNPSFRYYEVENESFNILNTYNYYFNLNDTFTNGGDEPTWKLEYSSRDLYDPEGTWPEDAPLNATFWHTYASQPLQNTTDVAFNQKFMNYKYRLSVFTPNCTTASGKLSNTCFNDNNCFLNFLSDDNINCQKG
ncbi:Acid sphingomyelin phosphodiesterase, putative [Candida maltosa Xu316]|uniref:Acid sphingomyelin phosphodiesterase, putative n=1 Tax=Candida maltosa (strain Xu316) TaxID=1245528 RepID=M3J6Q1_CANMX|nr:Acid sphingomyelin phosphodiesterase, putative [Candida maltosa Xu316]